ncbi:MAG: ASKHA domain-containing protein [Lachnospiraceae bacterium]|nr:ASKHA domain-containing protein [Lachnospiraceae bacterium]
MKVRFLPCDRELECSEGMTILQAAQKLGLEVDAPCGGHGKCGKCLVKVENRTIQSRPKGDDMENHAIQNRQEGDAPASALESCGESKQKPASVRGSQEESGWEADEQEVLACQTLLQDGMVINVEKNRDLSVVLSSGAKTGAKSEGRMNPLIYAPYHAAIDIGTTTLACQILDGKTGEVLSSGGALNPQQAFGADVVSRIQAALNGAMDELTSLIRAALFELLSRTAGQAGVSPNDIGIIGIVGNPCMQQLFEGILPDNLARPPFSVKLDQAKILPAGEIFPELPNAVVLSIPDIFGYIGGDTMGCVLSSDIYEAEEPVLLVDIGTNGEMVLGSQKRLVACATAAGPALEGAGITFGMRGSEGAIDHVTVEDGRISCHVIGQPSEPAASGICGSGLIDAVALLWTQGIINRRGRLPAAADCPAFAQYLGEKNGERIFYLTDSIYLTQEDIRQVQMAKGAIAAGIELMARELQIEIRDIQKVYLAGAFGSFIRKESACAIGLLPQELAGRVDVIGNAAIEGCRRMVCDQNAFRLTETLSRKIQALDLASVPGFARSYAKHMGF